MIFVIRKYLKEKNPLIDQFSNWDRFIDFLETIDHNCELFVTENFLEYADKLGEWSKK